ncbi:hypothetical protein D3C75_1023670 [compost metagenome]
MLRHSQNELPGIHSEQRSHLLQPPVHILLEMPQLRSGNQNTLIRLHQSRKGGSVIPIRIHIHHTPWIALAGSIQKMGDVLRLVKFRLLALKGAEQDMHSRNALHRLQPGLQETGGQAPGAHFRPDLVQPRRTRIQPQIMMQLRAF